MAQEIKQTRKYRLAVVSGHPTQWEGPLFAQLSQHLLIDLTVWYWSDLGLGTKVEKDSGLTIQWDLPVLEGYRSVLMRESPKEAIHLVREILSSRYDAVVVEGHAGLVFLLTIIACLLSRTAILYRSDSTLLYGMPRRKQLLSRMFLPTFYRFMSAFLPLSSLAADFLKAYGVPERKIYLAPYTIDNVYFRTQTEKYRLSRTEIRNRLGIGEHDCVALAILRFEERERPLDFLKAAAVVQNQAAGPTNFVFILVGDGPQRTEIEDFIAQNSLTRQKLVLPGFVAYSELPKFYAIADVFVHPAIWECWGLSVNEALASGVPVIVSDRVGAGYDLVRHGQNGFVFPAGDVDALARYIQMLALDSQLRCRMSIEAIRIMEAHSYAQCVNAFVRSLFFVRGSLA